MTFNKGDQVFWVRQYWGVVKCERATIESVFSLHGDGVITHYGARVDGVFPVIETCIPHEYIFAADDEKRALRKAIHEADAIYNDAQSSMLELEFRLHDLVNPVEVDPDANPDPAALNTAVSEHAGDDGGAAREFLAAEGKS